MAKNESHLNNATSILRCDTDVTESTESTDDSLSVNTRESLPALFGRDDNHISNGGIETSGSNNRQTTRSVVDHNSSEEKNQELLKNYMVAPSTSEERQNERYARKVGINFSISRGDYLTLFSGLSDDASASIATDGTEDATLSPQYGKKDDNFTFREMYGDVNQILQTTPKNKINEEHLGVFQLENQLITPRTRTAMIDHDQVIDTLRERAAILSIDWAKKEYMAPSLARRLRDFEFAQKKRRKKFGAARKFGILSLYDFLTAVREDVEWAEDAAFRRSNCLPYVRWCDFVASKKRATNRAYFAYGILLICTVSLIISIGLNDWAFESMTINPSLGPSAETLLMMGAKDSNLIVNSYQVWRLFTPMFLHGGLIHFGLNCFAMFYIGRAVEHNHGLQATAILFTIPAIGSTIISAIFLPQFISVGASGGIFGLIGACTMDIFRNRKVIFSDFINKGRSKRHHVLVVLLLIMDIFVNLLLGLTPFTDNFMHLGGFLLGCFCASTIVNLVDLFDNQNDLVNRRKTTAFLSRNFGPIIAGLTIIATTAILFQGDGITNPCTSCGYLSCVSFPPWTDYDNRWYYCDDCGRVIAYGRKDKHTGEYSSIEMQCPAGNTIFFSVDGYENDKESLQKNLPSFCRENCLN